jgi:hypothetical protein
LVASPIRVISGWLSNWPGLTGFGQVSPLMTHNTKTGLAGWPEVVWPVWFTWVHLRQFLLAQLVWWLCCLTDLGWLSQHKSILGSVTSYELWVHLRTVVAEQNLFACQLSY